jgi:hypothetical protein
MPENTATAGRPDLLNELIQVAEFPPLDVLRRNSNTPPGVMVRE